LRCWVCGGNNRPYSTNPNDQKTNGERKGKKLKHYVIQKNYLKNMKSQNKQAEKEN
jgi:hypothetical protein